MTKADGVVAKISSSGRSRKRSAANAAYHAATSGRSGRGSSLERRFSLAWHVAMGKPLVREHRFDAVRKWRFDFAHVETKTAIELEGGVWSGGAHNRGRGFLEDCEKYNAAALAGWTVFRLGTGQVRLEIVQAIAGFIEKRMVKIVELENYRLAIHPNGQAYLLNPIGEGMETSHARLAEYLRTFFALEF